MSALVDIHWGLPRLVGGRPIEFSTSTALVRSPEVIWDVNGYYRDLGVPVTATRRQLRQAYQRRGGQQSARLTYCLRQLLDPDTRAEYDRCRLGEPYLDDEVRAYVLERAKLAIREQVRRLRTAGVDMGEHTEDAYTATLLAAKLDQAGFDVLSNDGSSPDDSLQTVDAGLSEDDDRLLAYSYYVWRSISADDADYNLRRLARWQELLVRAFSSQGVTTRICVGLHGATTAPWEMAVVGFRTVVFLHDSEQPTSEMAAAVAASWAEW